VCVLLHVAVGVALLRGLPRVVDSDTALLEVELIAPEPPRPVLVPAVPPVRASPAPAPRAVAPAVEVPVSSSPPVIAAPAATLTRVEHAVPPPPSVSPSRDPVPAGAQREPSVVSPVVPQETPVTPPSFDAAYLDNPAPRYPPAAARLRESGRVLLLVRVGADGLPERVEVSRSSGSPRLDQAALETVRRWRFVPARQGERPVAAQVTVPLVFRLDE